LYFVFKTKKKKKMVFLFEYKTILKYFESANKDRFCMYDAQLIE
jgi:hypothetical protein